MNQEGQEIKLQQESTLGLVNTEAKQEEGGYKVKTRGAEAEATND